MHASLLSALLLCAWITANQTAMKTPQSKKDGPAWQFAADMMRGIDAIEKMHVVPTSNSQMIRWAIEGLYKQTNLPLPADIFLRIQRLDRPSRGDPLQLLHDARLRVGPLEEEEDLRICLSAIFAHLESRVSPKDRSTYIAAGPSCVLRDFSSVAIGLSVQSDERTGMLRVVTPIYGGPAHKAGIRAGDLISHIRLDPDRFGKPLPRPEIYSTVGMSPDEAERLFLGREGTAIGLTVIPCSSRRSSITQTEMQS